ncbi:hypothetical protein LCGC14_0455340 [marine sediment metagenome]|uniref:HD domain-containing protein n=1 Tax=marine sediment metagenome TaxID=412755 RepID=A0A0F9SGQ8_9ZZZZ
MSEPKAESKEIRKGGPFILTYTGKMFHYDHIEPDSIDIRDIAHALSHLCRYTGHTSMFYSVAQHSLLVSEKMPGGPADKLAGLLHDAAEAYVNDLASPLKRYIEINSSYNNVYRSLHDRVLATVYAKYGVGLVPIDVVLYDRAACVFEAEGLLGLNPLELEKYSFPIHLKELWQPWEPLVFAGEQVDQDFGYVETRFLERFENLMNQLGRTH